MPEIETPQPLPPMGFFLQWLRIGLQSFGGGTVTLALIRRTAVEERHWVTESEFTRDWALVQVAPGINLLGFVILMARRVDGARGIALALLGLLIPSAGVTILFASLYTRFAGFSAFQSALHGLLPATAGLGLVTTIKMAIPPLEQSRAESKSGYAAGIAIILGCAFAYYASHQTIPVLLLLLGGGLVLAGVRWSWAVRTHRHSTLPRPDMEQIAEQEDADE